MKTLKDIILSIQDLINLLIPVIFALAFIVFIWGIFKYFIAGGANEESRDNGKKLAIWGIIAFAIMISVWGLVNVVVGTFDLGSNTRPCLPTFSGPCQKGSSKGSGGYVLPDDVFKQAEQEKAKLPQ